MFGRLSFFLVIISILCENNLFQTHFLRRSTTGNMTSNYRLKFGTAYRQLHNLSPLAVYPLLANSENYDSKQVSNTLWNLLSIARFILSTVSIDSHSISHLLPL